MGKVNAGAAVGNIKDKVAGPARAAERMASPWIEWLARIGYAVRGLLYITVGVLAVELALGQGGAATDKNGAIDAIGGQPFGKFLLVVVVVGLVGYSLWGFVRAILDPLNRGTDPKGIAQRVGYVISGLSYGALIIPTVRYIMGAGGTGGGAGGSQDMTANLLAQPFGPWLVGLLGLIGMAGGLGQLFQAFTTDFKKDLKFREMNGDEQKWAIRIGQFGMTARGVVFAMLGFFILQAALNRDPKNVKGLDGALQTILHGPYGPWLLGLMAFGLASFGVYSLLCAKWIRIMRS
jgi:hypothetical protein